MGTTWTPFGGNATRVVRQPGGPGASGPFARVAPAASGQPVPPTMFQEWLEERAPIMRQPNIEEIPRRPGVMEALRDAVQTSMADTRRFAEYFPVVGDVIQGVDAATAAAEGRWGEAALGAGFAALPGAIGSIRPGSFDWFLKSKLNPRNAGSDFQEAKAALQELIRKDAAVPHPLEGQKRKLEVQHSTPALFSQLELNKTARTTGMGDQWQGVGSLYTTESPAVTQFYRTRTGKVTPRFEVSLPNLKQNYDIGEYRSSLLQDQDDLRRWKRNTVDPVKEAEYSQQLEQVEKKLALVGRFTGNARMESPQSYQSMLESIRNDLVATRARQATLEREMPKNWQAKVRELKEALLEPDRWSNADERALLNRAIDIESNIKDQRTRLSLFNDFQTQAAGRKLRIGSNSLQNTYNLDFFANPDELYNLQRPVDQQKAASRLVAGLNEFTVPSGTPAGGTPLGDHLAWIQGQYRPTVGRDKIYDLNEVILGNNPDNQFASLRPQLTDADPWQIMDALRSKGIVGNRYLTRASAEDPYGPQLSNFVITEPSRARMTDLWSLFPLAATGTAISGAMSRDNREPGPRVYNTNPSAARRRPGT